MLARKRKTYQLATEIQKYCISTIIGNIINNDYVFILIV